ncbi:MAG: DUF3820 family protein [Deltaproteobacteria bacterium]|nr:DUF3820 family protein [Deltaproteobacteria bacterium]
MFLKQYISRHLVVLPESHIVWFSRKGPPQGKLGDIFRTVTKTFAWQGTPLHRSSVLVEWNPFREHLSF